MRITFSKQNIDYPLPDPIKAQTDSFRWLINEGIEETLYEVGEIHDGTGRGWVLTFSNARIDKPNRTVEEAKDMGVTYDSPWYITAAISQIGTDKEKKKEIYMGDLPIMTEDGIFVVNGV